MIHWLTKAIMNVYLGCTVITLLTLGKCEEINRQLLPPFGKEMRREFYMQPNFTFLNHAFVGVYPKVILKAFRENQKRAEKNPDVFLKHELQPELTTTRNLISQLVGTSAEDNTITHSSTSAINAIFRSILFADGDQIVYMSTGSTSSIIKDIEKYSEENILGAPFYATYPMSNKDFLQDFEEFLNRTVRVKGPIRIAVIDHITSLPAVVLPIEQLVPIMKKWNIPVIVDGSFAPGSVPINITKIDPDFYIGSCNMWLYIPRAISFMYVKKQYSLTSNQENLYGELNQPNGCANSLFWTGTFDVGKYMTLPTALKFRKDAGGEIAIMDYNKNLAYKGGQYLANRFNTNVLQDQEQIGTTVDVRLPVINAEFREESWLSSEWFMNEQLVKDSNVLLPVYFLYGEWWLRISVQIYNDMNDFYKVGDVFELICNEINDPAKSANGAKEVFV